MAGMEGIIRPFVGKSVSPTRIYQGAGRSTPEVRINVGVVGGTKTFSYSGSGSYSTYLMAVHTEKTAPNFNMSTGEPR